MRHYLVSAQKMRELEQEANRKGMSYSLMMANAGAGLAQVVLSRFDGHTFPRCLGLVGPGNNGGDTLVALTILQKSGRETWASIHFRKDLEADELLSAYRSSGGRVVVDAADFLQENSGVVVLDGLLGTGTRLPLHASTVELLSTLKPLITAKRRGGDLRVVAVDCPSGMDCNTGEAPDCVLSADLTVCMAALKQGLVVSTALPICKEFQVVSIGLEDVIPGWSQGLPQVAEADLIRARLSFRPADGHKGTFGKVLVIGGMQQYSGAPLLASRGAYAVGAGLVQAAIPESLHPILAGHLPEAIWLPLREEAGSIAADAAEQVRQVIPSAQSVLVGPGIGLAESVLHFLERLFPLQINQDLSGTKPVPRLVFDADGLKTISRIPEWWRVLPGGSVLTPHPGEMAILTRLSTKEIQQERLRIAREYAQHWGHIVVLKGAGTVIASPAGDIVLIPVATSALAHAGSGDVLAGMVAGLLAEGLLPLDAAVCAAWIHAQAGLLAAREMGSPASVLPGDLVGRVSKILGEFWPAE